MMQMLAHDCLNFLVEAQDHSVKGSLQSCANHRDLFPLHDRHVVADLNGDPCADHKYPSLEGETWKDGINRITAHTDESLMTLLFTSPGDTPAVALSPLLSDAGCRVTVSSGTLVS
jgi:hypothetical protein